MERFVIRYIVDDCKSCEEPQVMNYTVRAESQDAIMQEIMKNIPAFVSYNSQVQSAKADMPLNEYFKTLLQYQWALPLFDFSIPVASIDGSNVDELFPELEIMTLDEWFDINSVEQFHDAT